MMLAHLDAARRQLCEGAPESPHDIAHVAPQRQHRVCRRAGAHISLCS